MDEGSNPLGYTNNLRDTIGSPKHTYVSIFMSQHSLDNPPSFESPCIRNCCLDSEDMCIGCFRSRDEILIWSDTDDQQRKQILHNCAERKNNKPSLDELVLR
jgi:predicted Fe-S protein YdhL (DUF1289 family)